MMDGQKFCLKWDSFQGSVTSVFEHLRESGELLDITLCCEGQRVRAHRMMLSACSPYFRDLLKNTPCQQMAIFLKDTSAADLHAVVEFMYKGSVNVAQSQLASFIKTAEMLQIRGLSGDDDKSPDSAPPRPPPEPRRQPPEPRLQPPEPRLQPPEPRLQPPEPRPQPPEPRLQPPEPRLQPPRPISPPSKRRRASDSGDAPAPAWPPAASPARRPETPILLSGSSSQSAPSPPPPPASPVAASTTAAASDRPVQRSADAPPPPPPPPAPPAEGIKVEKIDISDNDEGEGSLDAALGRLAEYEGGYGGVTDPVANTLGTAGAHGVSFPGQYPGVSPLPGPSQRTVVAMEDGSSPARPVSVCSVCGRYYSNRQALTHHMKMHQGLTTCQLCGKVLCIVAHLRRHLAQAHSLDPEQVRRLVPTANKTRYAVDDVGPSRVSIGRPGQESGQALRLEPGQSQPQPQLQPQPQPQPQK